MRRCEHVLERLWGLLKPPLDTRQQITIYSVAQKIENTTIKNKTLITGYKMGAHLHNLKNQKISVAVNTVSSRIDSGVMIMLQ